MISRRSHFFSSLRARAATAPRRTSSDPSTLLSCVLLHVLRPGLRGDSSQHPGDHRNRQSALKSRNFRYCAAIRLRRALRRGRRRRVAGPCGACGPRASTDERVGSRPLACPSQEKVDSVAPDRCPCRARSRLPRRPPLIRRANKKYASACKREPGSWAGSGRDIEYR